MDEIKVLANVCRLTIICKFLHGRGTIEEVQREFGGRFSIRGMVKIWHFDSKHIFINFFDEHNFKNIYLI